MADLRACFERIQLGNVTTYIQSGNVLFESRQKDPLRLAGLIENALARDFGLANAVVVLTQEQLERVVTQGPGSLRLPTGTLSL